MLSVNDEINLLYSQNEGLKQQNQCLQKIVIKYAKKLNKIFEICQQEADNMAVINLQEDIKAVINE